MTLAFRSVASLHTLDYMGGSWTSVKDRLHTMGVLMGMLERADSLSVDIMGIAPGMGDAVRVEAYFGEEKKARDFSRRVASGGLGNQYRCDRNTADKMVESIGGVTWLVVVFL